MMTTYETDVLVVGSGAAGLSAAIAARKQGLNVLIVEKEPYLGGTSAISGGWLWVPGNRQGRAEGDTREEAEAYIKALASDSYDSAAVARFLDGVPEALDFFERETEVEFVYPEMAPDYQMEASGAKRSGRAITVQRADARILGDDRLRVQPYLYTYTVFGYMPEVGQELKTFLKVNQSARAFSYVARVLLRTWWQTVVCRRSLTRTNGNALMTRLVATARKLDIPMWTSAPVVKLDSTEGVVTGARVGGNEPCRVHARVGVVLAAGGFGGNAELRKQAFEHDAFGDNHVTATVGHGGDSYRLAAECGGVLDTSPHQPAAWGPVSSFRSLRGEQRLFPHLRAFGLPGLIAVNRHGKRFANESFSYHDFGTELIKENRGQRSTFAYIIADRKAMRRYGIGYAKPWPLPTWYYKRIGFLTKGSSIENLAIKIGVPAEALHETVQEFNESAAKGVDPKFGRGSNWFHHFKGDMDHKPNPNLAPIDTGPYYAVRVQMGDLGTYAGLAVNQRSEVVTDTGSAIPGLYAVGSAAVSVFGGGYPGYGAVLGPAMVFGYLVGRDIATHAKTRTNTPAGTVKHTAPAPLANDNTNGEPL
ncbi:dehydrogenase (plasmid) [Mycobacterium adipatum]|uniref:Dehydrogenase n=1 Tax=Mycobacterium adipatum TaxID=1682113 RepID=A0A172UW33_9MYCO|nr:FAD-dependent oxidoreductase [Mycobacterium adipatum]ANE83347.1 dehydrogenase [Mycobacterium adipatum]